MPPKVDLPEQHSNFLFVLGLVIIFLIIGAIVYGIAKIPVPPQAPAQNATY